MHRDWQIAEKVSIHRRLRDPDVEVALSLFRVSPDDAITIALLQLSFRGRVLDELEKTHPTTVKAATAEVLR